MFEMDTEIRLAVAGCGKAGRSAVRAFSAMDGVAVRACCDTEEELASRTAAEFGISKYYTDIHELLDTEGLDGLVIAVPDAAHGEFLHKALEMGVGVFCESPLAADYTEAVEMTRAARESGLTAVINFPNRSNRLLSAACEYIESGRIGRIKYIEASLMQNRIDSILHDDVHEEKRLLWRMSSAAGSAGVLGELGSELFDLIGRIAGDPEELSAMVKNIAGLDTIEEYQELELSAGDTFVCQLSFSDGCAGLIRGSWTAGGPEEHYTLSVYGEDAVLKLDTSQSEDSFTVFSSAGREDVPAGLHAAAGPHDQFISALQGEIIPDADFDHALKIQYFVEQAMLSDQGGLRLQLEGK